MGVRACRECVSVSVNVQCAGSVKLVGVEGVAASGRVFLHCCVAVRDLRV
jgi:hypothetical protein